MNTKMNSINQNSSITSEQTSYQQVLVRLNATERSSLASCEGFSASKIKHLFQTKLINRDQPVQMKFDFESELQPNKRVLYENHYLNILLTSAITYRLARRELSDDQSARLESEFQTNHCVFANKQVNLVRSVGLSSKEVKIWFQGRRLEFCKLWNERKAQSLEARKKLEKTNNQLVEVSTTCDDRKSNQEEEEEDDIQMDVIQLEKLDQDDDEDFEKLEHWTEHAEQEYAKVHQSKATPVMKGCCIQ